MLEFRANCQTQERWIGDMTDQELEEIFRLED